MKLNIILVCLLLFSCKPEQIKTYDLDLTIKYDAFLNSFKIDNKGNAIILINEIGQQPEVCQATFSKSEMNFINKSIQNINFTKCDSIENDYADGTRYVLILTDQVTKKNTIILKDNCEQQKPLNDLVFYISRTFDKKKKEDYYKSISGLVFVKPDLSNVTD
ncbi:hypothetical protein [Flavobacterium sp. B183]|uniref:hypothetical protein n=1 Tax=Flavobacterium sp. B183 TaxID=907046 RepID=UPI00201F7D6C|nr:hypothetical protein [Flavobacterium sp. B183]URC11761.1 hypothetical protein M4I44_16885 [Flavobacterium sp. B183]